MISHDAASLGNRGGSYLVDRLIVNRTAIEHRDRVTQSLVEASMFWIRSRKMATGEVLHKR